MDDLVTSTNPSSSDSNAPDPELLRRLRDDLGALRRITGSQRLERTVAARSGSDIGTLSFGVLGKVIEEGPVRMRDLADALRMHPAALTRQVQALEADGLVERSPDPLDGRASMLTVTPEGRRIHRRYESASDTIMSEQLSSWTDRDLAALVESLDRLVADLRAVPASRRSKVS